MVEERTPEKGGSALSRRRAGVAVLGSRFGSAICKKLCGPWNNGQNYALRRYRVMEFAGWLGQNTSWTFQDFAVAGFFLRSPEAAPNETPGPG
jgi:hypothetical protein